MIKGSVIKRKIVCSNCGKDLSNWADKDSIDEAICCLLNGQEHYLLEDIEEAIIEWEE